MSKENKELWCFVDYDDENIKFGIEVLFTNRESLEHLTNQLAEIVSDKSGAKEFKIDYGANQNPREAPFQKVKFIEKPIVEDNIEIEKVSAGCVTANIVVILLLGSIFFFAAYGLKYWLQS